jgi:hypothetical protein
MNFDSMSRRNFLAGSMAAVSGAACSDWPSLAAEAGKRSKRCILLWMAGGPSHLDTFDMKPGRPVGGPFEPIQTNVTGVHVCEYLPNLAKQADKLAIIRSMRTKDPGHSGGTYAMHTGYVTEPNTRHPEIGAIVAKYLGDPNSDLPSFIQIELGGGESSPHAGAGFLGPTYQPFKLTKGGGLPENTVPYLKPEADQRRGDLLHKLEEGLARESRAEALEAHRKAQEQARRLLRAKGVFDVSAEWVKGRDRYGDSQFGMDCLAARKLIEAGVPFVEVVQHNYDSHSDNFEWHKALLPPLDQAWSALMQDLQERGLLDHTLIIWMGEVGRTPWIDNRAGRGHWVRAWSTVLAGGGIKGGTVYGASDADALDVKDKPVTEGDFFATIYTALGINPRTKNLVDKIRPVWLTPEGSKPIREILA